MPQVSFIKAAITALRMSTSTMDCCSMWRRTSDFCLIAQRSLDDGFKSTSVASKEEKSEQMTDNRMPGGSSSIIRVQILGEDNPLGEREALSSIAAIFVTKNDTSEGAFHFLKGNNPLFVSFENRWIRASLSTGTPLVASVEVETMHELNLPRPAEICSIRPYAF